MPESKKKILIVDDHPMMREGLAALISREPDLEVCGEAEDASQAIKLVQKLRPGLVLIDITLAGRNGIELIKDIHAFDPEVMMLVISMHDESLYAGRVLRAGGRGYIMKQEGGKKVMQAIRRVIEGEIYVSEKMASRILNLFSGRRDKSPKSPIESLTDRELEVFQLVAQASSSRDIGARLNISAKTVEVHKANIRQKLSLKSNAELISFAARWTATQNT